jgi:hypothetical protein
MVVISDKTTMASANARTCIVPSATAFRPAAILLACDRIRAAPFTCGVVEYRLHDYLIDPLGMILWLQVLDQPQAVISVGISALTGVGDQARPWSKNTKGVMLL